MILNKARRQPAAEQGLSPRQKGGSAAGWGSSLSQPPVALLQRREPTPHHEVPPERLGRVWHRSKSLYESETCKPPLKSGGIPCIAWTPAPLRESPGRVPGARPPPSLYPCRTCV